jgi:hypothetical protein
MTLATRTLALERPPRLAVPSSGETVRDAIADALASSDGKRREGLARLTGRAGPRRQPLAAVRGGRTARMTYFEMSEPGAGVAGRGTHSAGSLIGSGAPKRGAIRVASSAVGRDSISGRSWGKLSSTRTLVAI